MNIRKANKWDLPYIIEMLKHFREQTPIPQMAKCDNHEHINTLYHHLLLGGGLALVAETTHPIGMIMGIKNNSIWDPKIVELRELVFWVEPEHRGSTAGYRLLKQYIKQANEMIEENKITLHTMTKMTNSPDLDFGRFGYKKTEEVWVGGI